MASIKDLVKYYETLTKSFDKIQDRANKTVLINAALRPKISEDCAKSTELFDCYINYIKLFCIVYDDKFSVLSTSILIPLFTKSLEEEEASKLHDALKSITKSSEHLAISLATSIEKLLMDDKDSKAETYKAKHLNKFFVQNILRVCLYIKGEALVITLQALIRALSFHERLASPESTQEPISEYYEIIYGFMSKLKHSEKSDQDRIFLGFIEAYSRDEKVDFRIKSPNYVIFYIASLDEKYYEAIIENLWNVFVDVEHCVNHRKSSIVFIGSFIARANFIDIDRVMSFLLAASEWYTEILDQYNEMNCDRDFCQDREIICALAESIFYIISQRYREFYYDEIMKQLVEIDLDYLINSSFDPLKNCDPTTSKRFKDIANIIGLMIEDLYDKTNTKDLPSIPEDWTKPFPETHRENDMPDLVKKEMRFYVAHSIFTTNR